MPHYLSKSDFTTAYDCITKLYYKKEHYPDSMSENEYLRHLARGGYMIGKLATLKYGDGVLCDAGNDIEAAVRQTEELLKKDQVTIFEAAILSGKKLVRVDILKKTAKTIHLIEVKSKSYDSVNAPDQISKMKNDWKKYLLDVAYQYYVLSEVLTGFEIIPHLFVPDKSKSTNIEGMNMSFRIKQAVLNCGFNKYDVTVDPSKVDELVRDDIMTLIDVTSQVQQLLPAVIKRSDELLQSMQNGLVKVTSDLDKKCFNCQYTLSDEKHPVSGFNECWKHMPNPVNHIKDLYFVTTIGGTRSAVVNEWIKNKNVDLCDVPLSLLTGERGIRQSIQIENTKNNKEWFSGNLSAILRSFRYPIYFIDFEATLSALPFHKGMRPYELLAFQWSCHTIKTPGGEPVHIEWINTEPSFPSFKFAEALMKQIGKDGTILMWSHYENTVLKAILEQCVKYNYENSELIEWLKETTNPGNGQEGRLTDMNQLALKNYFHPLMKGKTSIKKTFPAVLSTYKAPRIKKWLDNFESDLSLLKQDNKGNTINPYELLPSISVYEKSEVINEGTGAMRAYEDLLFGINRGDNRVTEEYKKALLRYCKLDTLAMVIIWEHWNHSLKK